MSNGGQEVFLINTQETLDHVLASVPAFWDPSSAREAVERRIEQCLIVSIDCKFTQKRQAPTSVESWNWQVVVDELSLVQVATSDMTYLFDCVALPPRDVCDALRPLLESSNSGYIKLFHGLHENAHCLAVHGGIERIQNALDTQLAAEHLWGDMLISLSQVIRKLGLAECPSKREIAMKNQVIFSHDYWKRRPLNQLQINYAAKDVNLLLEIWPQLMDRLGQDLVDGVISASEMRAEASMPNATVRRPVCFDSARNYASALASPELMSSMNRGEHVIEPMPIVIECEAPDLIGLIPTDLRARFEERELELPLIDSKGLRDVILDLNRRPVSYPVV